MPGHVFQYFCFLTGMYHMFLLIKDGFFHITNLALAKIETGTKILYKVDFRFLLEPLFWPNVTLLSFFSQPSNWKNRCGSFESRKLCNLLSMQYQMYFNEQQKYNQSFPSFSSSRSSRSTSAPPRITMTTVAAQQSCSIWVLKSI